MSNLLEWEINWIDNHPELYKTEQHRSHVIECIKKRYFINAVKRLVKQFEEKPVTANKFILFEFIENANT